MADIVDSKTRSRMMSGIQAKNTKPEVFIRSLLHRNGFRFRLHSNNLPGKPDIVLKRYDAVILVNGCFWHGHDCHLFKWPKTRSKFWKDKIFNNIRNDKKVLEELNVSGWRTCIIWECSVKGAKVNIVKITRQLTNWLESRRKFKEIIR